ncbi:hypothetical protein SARC_14255, partial [Sphaeroforma arctica JP610]
DTAAKPRKQCNFNAKRAPSAVATDTFDLSKESSQEEEDDSDGEMVMSREVDYGMETKGNQVEPDDLNLKLDLQDKIAADVILDPEAA